MRNYPITMLECAAQARNPEVWATLLGARKWGKRDIDSAIDAAASNRNIKYVKVPMQRAKVNKTARRSGRMSVQRIRLIEWVKEFVEEHARYVELEGLDKTVWEE